MHEIGRSFVRKHHSTFSELRVDESSYTGGFDASHMLATARAGVSTLTAGLGDLLRALLVPHVSNGLGAKVGALQITYDLGCCGGR